jgi:hypothetical protein
MKSHVGSGTALHDGMSGADGYEDTRIGWLGGDLYYYLAASGLCG